MYLALLAASAPALKPFFRRFLVEPIGSVVDSSKRKRSHKHGDYGQPPTKSRGWSIKSVSVRDSAAMNDPERIGVAYGGSDLSKSREESFVREIDDGDLETRRFELRHSREGKIVPMQVWKKTSTPHTSDPMPNLPSNQDQGHVRNFSQPHSYTSSDSTAVNSRHMQRRTSQGSVKAGRLAAKQHIGHVRDDSKTAVPGPKRPVYPTAHEGRGSRLDTPSDSDSEGDYYGAEKPAWREKRNQSRSRSTSDETLHLPRMGSRDFDPERGTRWGGNIGHGR